jgi:hypothetical protein
LDCELLGDDCPHKVEGEGREVGVTGGTGMKEELLEPDRQKIFSVYLPDAA